MSKRRLAIALVLGLIVAVFVSACGVALGPIQITAGGPVILSPTISGLHLPGLTGTHTRAVMHSMHSVAGLQINSRVFTLEQFAAGGCHGLH